MADLKRRSVWDENRDKLFTDRKQGHLFLARGKNRVYRLYQVKNPGFDGEREVVTLKGTAALGYNEADAQAVVDAAIAAMDRE